MILFVSSPDNLIAQIGAITTGTLSDLAPYATLIIGVGFGLWILTWLIDTLSDQQFKQHSQKHLDSLPESERQWISSQLTHAEASKALRELENRID